LFESNSNVISLYEYLNYIVHLPTTTQLMPVRVNTTLTQPYEYM